MSARLLSPHAQRVLASLSDEFATPGQIALRADLPKRTRAATVARICDALVQDGLAERAVIHERQRWRKVPKPSV